MPLSFTGIDPAQATALTSLANRQQQTLVPQFAYQRALLDASKQQAMAALALNRQQILNQRAITTGAEQTNLGLRDIQRNALTALNQYRTGVSTAISQQGTAADMERQLREMRLKSLYGQYAMQDTLRSRDIQGVNAAIGNLSSAASSLYQANQQKNYAKQLIDYINGLGSETYPTWQYTKTSGGW
jgi:hypothetical protein